MDEFVIVLYPRRRGVEVDGVETAKTNERFILETGTYEFSLTGPDNYTPRTIVQPVEDTTAQDPCVITFTPKAKIEAIIAKAGT